MRNRLFALALLLAPACRIVLAADIEVGSDRVAVIKQWGQPKSRMALGKNETLIYDQGFQVYLQDGKVAGFKNRNLAPAASSGGTTNAKFGGAAPADFELKVPDLSSYRIPKPTIYSDSNYRVRGSWGGESG